MSFLRLLSIAFLPLICLFSVAPAFQSDELPLKSGKKIKFSTDEVTWMNLDISPDGKTLVFDVLGDLYLLPIRGGKAERVTSGMALDTQPRFSPDGKRIVFLSDRSGAENIWLLDVGKKITDTTQPGANSGLRALTTGNDESYASPEWSPDGKNIVATRTSRFTWIDVDHNLWIYDVNTGSGVPLLYKGEPIYALGAAFGTDSLQVYFSNRHPDNEDAFGHRIQRYDLKSGKLTEITRRVGGAIRPALSPGGKWLVYGSRHDGQTGYRLHDLETETEKWLAFPVQPDQQENNWMGTSTDHMPGYTFTPDSRAIITSLNGKICRIDVPSGTVSEIAFEVDFELDISPVVHFDNRVPDGPVKVRQIRHPVISPDGKKVAFTALHKLYIKELPDGQIKRIPEMPAGQFMPAWSWDGKWIAFVTWSDDNGGHLYKVKPDGRDLKRLSRLSAFYSQPAWSPDGEQLVVIKGPWQQRGQNLKLVRIPANGGNAVFISKATGSRPHFSEDPDRVFMNDDSAGLVSVRLDGTDRKVHLRASGRRPALGPGGPELAPEVLIAPDGVHTLVRADYNVYVVTVANLGTEVPEIAVNGHDFAAFPVRKLNELGTHYPNWGARGTAVTWALGSTLFRYDLDRADEPGYQAEQVAIEIEFPRQKGKGDLALRGATVITMDKDIANDGIIEDGTVLIQDNRITEVGAAAEVSIPANTKVIDVKGMFILPGFIDLHAHTRRDLGIQRQTLWAFLENLAFGVTTTRDPQAFFGEIFTYGDLVETGEIVGPRVFSTGPGVFNDTPVNSLEDARKVLKRYSDYYRVNTIKQYLAGNRRQRQLISMAAREMQLIPTTEGIDMKTMVTQVFDGYSLEHVLPHYPLFKDMIQLMVQSGTYYDPTIIVSTGPRAEYYYWTRTNVHDNAKVQRFMPHDILDRQTRRVPWYYDTEFSFKEYARTMKDIVEAGGNVTVGSHGEMQGICYHWELWNIQSGGMSEMDALRCATVAGAEAIGFSEDLGSLKAGKLADLLVLTRNPLENIRNTTSLKYVMKNGLLYNAETLDMLWPVERKLPKPYWWDDPPSTSGNQSTMK